MKYLLTFFLSITLAFSQSSDEFDAEFNDKNTFDPLSGYNRMMTSVNDKIYTYIFDPVVDGYRYVVPAKGREVIANVFDNLLFPLRFVNNILQFKFQNAADETLRFIANTIVGFGGISDVATTYYKIPRHDEDFGQTLGHWGVGSGFHIVWPIFGPSNLRDTFGLVGDFFAKPINYVDPNELSLGLNVGSKTNEMAQNPDMYKNLKKDAVDLYPFLRDAYEQRRDYLIKE
ncbi:MULTISPECIES: MlaA family lipoprotein [unclassified Campylobacter]|uniref:MlaA family lipoprotein n=1 Tax=unclassified Campylobacter TaxID=2593542 RepID=UPI003D325F31